MKKNVLVIFGPVPNPKFEKEARRIAKLSGCQTAVATYNGEPVKRPQVHLANGYKFDLGSDGLGITDLIFFECEPAAGCIFSIDEVKNKTVKEKCLGMCFTEHWSKYGLINIGGEYFVSSSVGKLYSFLQMTPSLDTLMMVAAEICPGEAYQGKCVGFSKHDFSVFRFEQKMRLYNENIETQHLSNPFSLMLDITKAEELLKELPVLDGLYDARATGFVSELTEAAYRLGYPCILREPIQDGTNLHAKYVLRGYVTPKDIASFNEWAACIDYKISEILYPKSPGSYSEIIVQAEPYQHSV